jgi:hypothetical protein
VTINVIVSHDIGPNLIKLGGKIVALFDDLKVKLEELRAEAASEHEQVMAVLGELQAKIGESVSPAEKTALDVLFADAKAAIKGVYEPPAAEG